MTQVVSKAQEKRNKDKKNLLKTRLNSKLIHFKNQYILDYVSYKVHQIRSVAETFDGMSEDEINSKFIGMTKTTAMVTDGIVSTYEYILMKTERAMALERGVYNVECKTICAIQLMPRKRAIQNMKIIEILKADFYKEAIEGFEYKLEKLVNKMMRYEWKSSMQVDHVKSAGHNFEILVYDKPLISRWDESGDTPIRLTDEQYEEKRRSATDLYFHARMIYANGLINAPHFRFITTTRQTYLSK
jgi:hypothetical protein